MTNGPLTNVRIRNLIWRMFRDSADVDYLIARFSVINQLEYQFFWSASQAIEKYLKAILLLNSVSVKPYSRGHDLLPLYDRATEVCGNLIPLMLCPPNCFPSPIGFDRTSFAVTRDFIEYLSDNGDPASRYRHSSVVLFSSNLHPFDELSFCLRRLAIPLDMTNWANVSYRDFLKENPNFQLHRFQNPGPTKGHAQEELIKYSRLMNFSFFPDEAMENGKKLTGVRATNSAIYLLTEQAEPETTYAIQWLFDNVKLSKGEESALRNLTGFAV